MRAITGATRRESLGEGTLPAIDQPAESAVTVENILAPHRERTLRRMRGHDTVLCIQDGTRLTSPGAARPGAGGHRVEPDRRRGAACTCRRWRSTPTGWRWACCGHSLRRARAPQPHQAEAARSFRWVEGLRDLAQAAERLPETRVVCTMDRGPTSSTCSSSAARTPRRSTCWSARRSTASWARRRRPTGRRSRAVCSTRCATRRPAAPPRSRCSVTFGGPDGTTLFITARTSLYRVEMRVSGQ